MTLKKPFLLMPRKKTPRFYAARGAKVSGALKVRALLRRLTPKGGPHV